MDKVSFAREMSRAMITDFRKPYAEQLLQSDLTGLALAKDALLDIQKAIQSGGRYAPVYPNIYGVASRYLDRSKLPRLGAGMSQFDWGALVGSVVQAGASFAAASIKAQTEKDLQKMTIAAQTAEAERQRQAQLQAIALQAQLSQNPPAVPAGSPGAAPSAGGLPSWVLPVGIGAVVLIGFLALKR
jgi:hypothetical protein